MPKTYVPKCNARTRKTNFGDVLSVGFDVKELIAFAEANKNERGFLNLEIAPRKEPNEFATHSVYLDDYKPGQRQASAPSRRPPPGRVMDVAAPEAQGEQPPDHDDVPF